MNKLGFFATSTKKNEKRFPLHPDLFHLVSGACKSKMLFEKGYGAQFGLTDDFFQRNFGGVFSRESLFEECDVVVLPKPTPADFKFFKENHVLWGWPHCVQGAEITQIAIDKKLTLIAWEAMFGGGDNVHIFQRNNELAGYAAVHHLMMLIGQNGYFGTGLRAAVLGFGSSGRGAVHGLQTLGINDIDVYTKRESHLIAAPAQGVEYGSIKLIEGKVHLRKSGVEKPASVALGEYDLIVNCVLQDPLQPLNYVYEDQLADLKRVKAIIDVSCDRGMGFYFAKPTDFDNPTFLVGESNIVYYSVDHTPTLYWDAASYEISKAIIPFLEDMTKGAWADNEVLSHAIEIDKGHILNDKILKFQHRGFEYPHSISKGFSR